MVQTCDYLMSMFSELVIMSIESYLCFSLLVVKDNSEVPCEGNVDLSAPAHDNLSLMLSSTVTMNNLCEGLVGPGQQKLMPHTVNVHSNAV